MTEPQVRPADTDALIEAKEALSAARSAITCREPMTDTLNAKIAAGFDALAREQEAREKLQGWVDRVSAEVRAANAAERAEAQVEALREALEYARDELTDPEEGDSDYPHVVMHINEALASLPPPQQEAPPSP